MEEKYTTLQNKNLALAQHYQESENKKEEKHYPRTKLSINLT